MTVEHDVPWTSTADRFGGASRSLWVSQGGVDESGAIGALDEEAVATAHRLRELHRSLAHPPQTSYQPDAAGAGPGHRTRPARSSRALAG